ncbi:MAG: putative zinc-binding peptidase [Neomegalonema sp.]|nr:putative zinc-binding peptidase [Neomegalonema sp.]
MKIYTCPNCDQPLFFDNLVCACGTEVAFDPEADAFVELATPCANRAVIGCNWAGETADKDGDIYCRSCTMSEIVPAHHVGDNLEDWGEAEAAKRWVLANLGRWGWFKSTDPGRRPVFHMRSEKTRDGDVSVIMGHSDGVITINVSEADDVERVRRREKFNEAQRTMIGHFRHEIAHFLFLRMFHDPSRLADFREIFGDESADYGEALKKYYTEGAPKDWNATFISAYATAHPHEDWAESCAHFLHLTDIVDSFYATGLKGAGAPTNSYDAYAENDPNRLIEIGARLGVALNHVNRSMGVADIYPFVHTPAIRTKLAFAHLALMESRPTPDRSLLKLLREFFRG